MTDVKIILFNGPPGSGKDTACGHVAHQFSHRYDIYHMKFARPVKEGCHGLFNITDSQGRVVKHDHFEPVKNDPNPEFRGLSPREAYIWYSEEVMKPKFGLDIFGQMALAEARAWLLSRNWNPYKKPLILCSDSGFDYEAAPFVSCFGPDAVRLVRLSRAGHSFKSDSRSHIDMPGVPSVDITNNGDDSFFRMLDGFGLAVLGDKP